MTSTIIISAGGTGGHIFPAQATAEYFYAQGYSIIYITDSRGMRYADGFKNYTIIELPTVNIRKGSLLQRLKGGISLIKSIAISIKTMRKYKPKHAIGFGGYPSFPSGVAAALLRVPLYLHEQNMIIGKTNKILSLFAKKIFTSFENIMGLSSKKITFTGNPIRTELLQYLGDNKRDNINDDHFNILVTGGSQGALIFSKIIPEALDFLPHHFKDKLHITHQTPKDHTQITEENYQKIGFDNVNIVPFIDNMGRTLSNADFIIARSGAGTLSEIATFGKASLLVPLPHSADDQQKINAEYFTKNNAALIIEQKDLSPTLCAGAITQILTIPVKKQAMEQAAKKLGHDNAAQYIFDGMQS